jgi:hypothetical protein
MAQDAKALMYGSRYPRKLVHQPSLLSTKNYEDVGYTPTIVGGASCRLPPAPVTREQYAMFMTRHQAYQETRTVRNLFQTPEYTPPNWKRPWWGKLVSNRPRHNIYFILFGPPQRSCCMYFCTEHNALDVIRCAERYRFLGGVWRHRYWCSRYDSLLYGVLPLNVWGTTTGDYSQYISPFVYLNVETLEVDFTTWQPAPALRSRSLLDELVDHECAITLPSAQVLALTGVNLRHPLKINVATCTLMSKLTLRERSENCTQLELLAYDIYRKLPESRISYSVFRYHEDAP